jgi:hypothetical protein
VTARILVTVAALVVALATSVTAQPPRPRPIPPRGGGQQTELPRGTAVLRGTIVAADSGSPIRRAQVRVAGQGSRLATTDAQGRYEVRELPAGRYTITASKAGFVSLEYGQKRPSESGTPLEISDGQVLDKLIIALPRGSVISGRITDEFGEPVANAVVTAMRYGYAAGTRRLLPGGGQNSRDTTDDQGSFRLFGLSPGEYVVSASYRTGGEAADPAGENTGYAATYFPGTPNVAEAQRVSVALGQEQSSVVFSLIATRLVRVTGVVLNSQGTPVTEGNVMLSSSSGRIGVAAPMTSFGGSVDRNGQFRVTNVPPGRYIAQVRPGRGPRNSPGSEFARQEITVAAQDLDGVVLVTAPAARITGVVVSESSSTATLRPQEVTIGTRPADIETGMAAGNSQGRVNEDWTFEVNNVFEPRIFRVNTLQGWTLKSVTLNGEDITDVPITVTPGQALAGVQVLLSDRVTEVNGRLVDSRNRPVTDATVVIFPNDEARWVYQSRFIRAARPDQDGRFQLRGLPPYADYLAIAVQGLEDGQAGDPEFLATIRDRATRLSLKDGEAKVVDLRVP